MNRDVKVGIFVLIVISSSLGFVLLAAPAVKKDSLEDIKPTLFSFSKKSDESSKKAYWDEDLTLEMESPTGAIELSSAEEKASVKTKFIEISQPEKVTTRSATDLTLPNTENPPNSPIKEATKELNSSSEKVDKKLEKDDLVADIKKKEENNIITNKPIDKPLEPKVLEDTYYTVKEGDTLSNIARMHYKDMNKHKLISDANKGLKAKDLKIGMKIFLPGAESQKKLEIIMKPIEKPTINDENKIVVYTVKSGDTISTIARKFFGKNYLMEDFKKANPGKDLGKLKIGQTINIPGTNKK